MRCSVYRKSYEFGVNLNLKSKSIKRFSRVEIWIARQVTGQMTGKMIGEMTGRVIGQVNGQMTAQVTGQMTGQ
jgi:outer membrane lipoprotein SlyB